MDLFASMLCKLFASILWSSIRVAIASIIQKTGLRWLSNSWNQNNCSSLLTLIAIKLPCEPTVAMATMTFLRNCFVGATSDCKDCQEYASLENENTPTANRGILTNLHEKCFGRLGLVINDGLDNLILSHHSFSNNYLLVNCG